MILSTVEYKLRGKLLPFGTFDPELFSAETGS